MAKKASQVAFDEFMQVVKDYLESKGRRMLYAGGWWEYRNGVWSPWTAKNEDAMHTTLLKLASPREFPYSTYKAATWTTMAAYFGSEEPIEFDRQIGVVCSNATYFLADDRIEKHSPDHYLTRRVDVKLDLDAECPEWLAMLNRIFADRPKEARKETIDFLQEWMGVAIVGGERPRELQKALICYGETRTGKSAVSDLLIELLGGKERIASASIDELCTRFGLEMLVGASALVASEAANPRTKGDAAKLKNLITGEQMSVDRKGRPAITHRFNIPVMFTTNNLPKIEDETDALYNRMVVLEFNRQFDEDDAKALGGKKPVAFLKSKNELPGILNWCLEGYDRAWERKAFQLPSAAMIAGERFRRQNDKVYDFVSQFCTRDKKVACSSQGLAWACVQFADEVHGTKISPATAQRALAGVVRSVVHGAQREQGYHEKQQFMAYHGLRLKDDGMRFFEAAGNKGYSGYKEVSRRMNYRIQ